MIDHIGFPVADYARSTAFYTKALAPLGYVLITEVQQDENDSPAAGFGANGKPDFWIGGVGGLNRAMHVAIAASDRAAVDAFHRAALAAGGKDNGAPGLRPHYHPNYYGTFVFDPDGPMSRPSVTPRSDGAQPDYVWQANGFLILSAENADVLRGETIHALLPRFSDCSDRADAGLRAKRRNPAAQRPLADAGGNSAAEGPLADTERDFSSPPAPGRNRVKSRCRRASRRSTPSTKAANTA